MKTESVESVVCELPISTAVGTFLARYSSKGLCELDFPSRTKAKPGEASPRSAVPAEVRRWHEQTASAVQSLVGGKPAKDLPPLDVSRGTEFQQQVWQAMRKIGFGRTSTYGELARAIGRPKAVRAVGGACGANPIPVLIPCHRVVAGGGRLGGFSGGLDWKRRLLGAEGLLVPQSGEQVAAEGEAGGEPSTK